MKPFLPSVVNQGLPKPEALALVVRSVEVYLPLDGMVDIEEERRRLGKELAEAEAELARLESHSNPDFRAKAKPEVVAREQEKLRC